MAAPTEKQKQVMDEASELVRRIMEFGGEGVTLSLVSAKLANGEDVAVLTASPNSYHPSEEPDAFTVPIAIIWNQAVSDADVVDQIKPWEPGMTLSFSVPEEDKPILAPQFVDIDREMVRLMEDLA